jgi:hypothetical protein
MKLLEVQYLMSLVILCLYEKRIQGQLLDSVSSRTVKDELTENMQLYFKPAAHAVVGTTKFWLTNGSRFPALTPFALDSVILSAPASEAYAELKLKFRLFVQ